MIYLFIALGLLGVLLSASKKRSICVVYVLGLALELLLTWLYRRYGLLETNWDQYFFGVMLIDLFTLAFMSWCYHKDYFLVYPLIFLTAVSSGTIAPEWILTGTTYIQSVRLDVLQALNVAVLLILIGRSDGVLRILDKLWLRLLWPRNEWTRHLLRLDNSSGHIQEMEK